MRAKLIVSEKFVYDDGAIRQIVIWLVPRPVPPSTHSLKYRMVYAVDGQRRIGFDNERGKGDHGHFEGSQFDYRFTNIAQLLIDFGEAIQLLRTTDSDNVIDVMQALRRLLQIGDEQ